MDSIYDSLIHFMMKSNSKYHSISIFTRPVLQKGSSIQEEILSVCLCVCVFVRNHFFLLRIFNDLMVIYFLKAHDVSYPNSDRNTNTETKTKTKTKTMTKTKTKTPIE